MANETSTTDPAAERSATRVGSDPRKEVASHMLIGRIREARRVAGTTLAERCVIDDLTDTTPLTPEDLEHLQVYLSRYENHGRFPPVVAEYVTDDNPNGRVLDVQTELCCDDCEFAEGIWLLDLHDDSETNTERLRLSACVDDALESVSHHADVSRLGVIAPLNPKGLEARLGTVGDVLDIIEQEVARARKYLTALRDQG